ncbi:MAG: AAC(3) family N-acetyltransferase, partial [Gilliamella sp.]|nr:AAC(3) family N-acetyltransferase [Gilliamella sp.]
TKNDLKEAFEKLGVKSTDSCIVRTAMSKIQYFPDGAETIFNALKETLSDGTLMMPSEISTNCDPATDGLGVTPEYFRNLPGVVRSSHPFLPIAIWGRNAKKIAEKQPLNIPYGINSPLDYLYQNNGKTICTKYRSLDMDLYDESNKLGAAFEARYSNDFKSLKLVKGTIKVINLHPLIDFTCQWFNQKDH